MIPDVGEFFGEFRFEVFEGEEGRHEVELPEKEKGYHDECGKNRWAH